MPLLLLTTYYDGGGDRVERLDGTRTAWSQSVGRLSVSHQQLDEEGATGHGRRARQVRPRRAGRSFSFWLSLSLT